eukprot:CAMPEP_0116071626 /NCGR_PEP_ID=MMETSP0322-20121206/13907_1 /TAXON_ID=163516 /ORGANISM="Leptocylindrus danicus var. apora, Strain B651" /LENGTH=466 /DNA_ID=CAMNT_0003560041 /DNA_START=321 /DNA_END=1719 /DNA_ORIENTATION=+
MTTSSEAFVFQRSNDRSLTFTTATISSSSNTRLHAGIEGGRKKKEVAPNPEEKVSAYVEPPKSLDPRANLDGKVFVSGYVNTPERSDQQVFDILNNHDGVSAFDFSAIVAFCDDAPAAKKRLLSRSARYTGLLDKLEIVQSTSAGALPTAENLMGASCWVAKLDATDPAAVSQITDVTNLAKQAGVSNLAITVVNSHLLDSSSVSTVNAYVGDGVTVAFVGSLDDMKKEGSHPYRILDIENVKEDDNKILADTTFSREESVRIVTESLGLVSASKRTIALTSNVSTNSTAAVLIKGLRAAGYSRPQEINDIMDSGVEKYEEAIETYKKEKYERENPDPEKLAREKEEQEKQMAIDREKRMKEIEEEKKKEIEELATEWAKREYFRKSLGGNMAMNEEEYIKSVWERAMFEGDLKWRMYHGRDTDERKELAEFLSQQEKKKEVALKRAQEAFEKNGGLGGKKEMNKL